MFQNCNTNTDQGNLGLSSAIFKLTQKGIVVSVPLIQNLKYDLVAEVDGRLSKVQVKTTAQKSRKKNQRPIVNLKTSGGNKSGQKIKNREHGDYDYLYVLTSDDLTYFIPVDSITSKTELTLSKEFDQFKL